MSRTMPTSFAILLRQHRIEEGLTQEELAERARLSARGDPDRAEAVLGPIAEQPVGTGNPADASQCCQVVGMLRAGQGRWDEARGYFERALAESERFPFVQGRHP